MTPVKIAEVVRGIHALDADLVNYERKYGLVAQTTLSEVLKRAARREPLELAG